MAGFVRRREIGTSRRLWAAATLLCAAFALAACGDIGRFQTASPTASPAKPNRTVAQTPAAEREHERILSSYGGAYDDPKLEGLIGKTVDRLVAASAGPEAATTSMRLHVDIIATHSPQGLAPPVTPFMTPPSVRIDCCMLAIRKRAVYPRSSW